MFYNKAKNLYKKVLRFESYFDQEVGLVAFHLGGGSSGNKKNPYLNQDCFKVTPKPLYFSTYSDVGNTGRGLRRPTVEILCHRNSGSIYIQQGKPFHAVDAFLKAKW